MTTEMNCWKDTEPAGFLEHLRATSYARRACREMIKEELNKWEKTSILEVGIGGLNEFEALKEHIGNSTYVGIDSNDSFIVNAVERYPDYVWVPHDIVREEPGELPQCKIVYSQHVLEHCPGLNPALTNMLSMAKRTLLNIFFLPPTEIEKPNCIKYPLYLNTYSRDHIWTVCKHNGFHAEFRDYDNSDLIPQNAPADGQYPARETVLIATRK